MKLYRILFSPTGGTRRVVEALSVAWEGEWQEIDLTLPAVSERGAVPGADDVALVGVPSYSGRVPAVALERLRTMQAHGTRAVLVCAYGNRAYEDTLIELADALCEAGFRVVGAVAAVAEHSIARCYGAGRPDARDCQELADYSNRLWQALGSGTTAVPSLPGHRPYRRVSAVGLVPRPTAECTRCGVCAARCPVQAIDPERVDKVNRSRCISCMRCVSVCPHGARRVNRALLFVVRRLLRRACATRKPNELFL